MDVLALAGNEAGEWVSAYIFFSIVFLVATVGVTALGVWVVRGDLRNRRLQREVIEQRAQEVETAGAAPGDEGLAGQE